VIKTNKIIVFLTLSFHIHAQLDDLFMLALKAEKSGDIFFASKIYETISKHNPFDTTTLYNYAHTLKDLGHMEQAIEIYQQVITREPHNNYAHFGLGQCYGALGQFEKAFPLFEYRSTDIKIFSSHIQYIKKLYLEQTPLSGLRILLRAEWGLGDVIQFIRYAHLLHSRGATIIVQSYPELEKLLNQCRFIDTVVKVGQEFPEHHLQLPLLSLPYICSITKESCCPIMPYLYAEPTMSKTWGQFFASYKTFTVGICWEGKGDINAPPLLNKNIPTKELEPLCSIPGVTLFSLQRITPNSLIPSGIITFDDSFDKNNGRFMDTAAIMEHLDLIITIDTSIAHLAGALDKPVWLMAPHRTDWRWGLHDSSSNFYPSMRIFRQAKPGDWHGVIQSIIHELKKVV
jgi:tetratricopeptide (TPR) repeat protein